MSEPDEARDAHLREALRHAPDAQLQAPPQLSELILKEARAKARDPKPAATPAPSGARRVWDWLARPAVATGFAGVMAATLVGLMWWDQPMDEAMPRSPVPAAAPAAEPVPPAASEAPPMLRTSPSDAAATAPAKPEPPRKKAAEAPRNAAAGTAAPARSDAGPAAPAPVAMPPAPAPAPAAAPALSADADASTEALAKARVKEEEHQRERSRMASAEAPQRRAAAKAQLNESRLQLEGEAYTRVASVRAAIASEATRWAWQRAGADTQPMNDAVYGWLAQLDSSTGTQWQLRSARETTAPRGRALALLRDGQLQHSFQITERGVLWQRGQTAWQVELPAETLAALQAALDSAAP
jgi:hypothetical protein